MLYHVHVIRQQRSYANPNYIFYMMFYMMSYMISYIIFYVMFYMVLHGVPSEAPRAVPGNSHTPQGPYKPWGDQVALGQEAWAPPEAGPVLVLPRKVWAKSDEEPCRRHARFACSQRVVNA